ALSRARPVGAHTTPRPPPRARAGREPERLPATRARAPRPRARPPATASDAAGAARCASLRSRATAAVRPPGPRRGTLFLRTHERAGWRRVVAWRLVALVRRQVRPPLPKHAERRPE